MSQTLLNYRLAGVDKDEATRAKLRQLSDQATEISLTFAKNVQENVNRVEVRDASELDGLPEDYIRNHPADAQGVITLTTDYPDMQPVMTFARSADLRLRMFRAYKPAPTPRTGRCCSICWRCGSRLPRSSALPPGPIWQPPTS